MVAEVIINSTAKKLNRTFDYQIPKELEDMVLVGSKVLVPFGRFKNLEEAHVVKIKTSSKSKILQKLKQNLQINKLNLQDGCQKDTFVIFLNV